MSKRHDDSFADRRASGDDEVTTQAVNSPRVKAGPCPRNPNHPQTRVTSTQGRTRYCICDDCGKRWKRIGPEAGSEIPASDADTVVVDKES